jgi:hypothetical protein
MKSKKAPKHGNGNYKFGPTAVKNAKELPGAAAKAVAQQEGLNRSKLTPATMPDCNASDPQK